MSRLRDLYKTVFQIVSTEEPIDYFRLKVALKKSGASELEIETLLIKSITDLPKTHPLYPMDGYGHDAIFFKTLAYDGLIVVDGIRSPDRTEMRREYIEYHLMARRA